MGDVKKHHTQINSSRKKVLTKVQHPRDASIQGLIEKEQSKET